MKLILSLFLSFMFFLDCIFSQNCTVFDSSDTGMGYYAFTNTGNITIDGFGNKWFATGYSPLTEGLVKYDDANWVLFDTSNSGIPGNKTGKVDFDIDGSMWVTVKGLAKYSAFNWKQYRPFNDTTIGSSVFLSIDEATNTKWIGYSIGNNIGLASFNDTSWVSHYWDIGGQYLNFLAIQQPNINFPGVVKINTQTMVSTSYSYGLGTFPEWAHPVSMAVEEKFVWFNCYTHIIRLNTVNDTWITYDRSVVGMPSNDGFQGIVIDKSGNKWMGSKKGGLIKFDNVGWTVFDSTNSCVPCKMLDIMAIDSAGALWGKCNNLNIIRINNLPMGEVEQNYSTPTYTLSPNPTTGKFSIVGSSELGLGSVYVYNNIGQIILSQTLPEGEGQGGVIDITNQPAGIYFVRIFSPSAGESRGEVFLQKVVKE
jgi:hypothetical protein